MATCTPIYLSDLGFNFPRSYVRGISILDATDTPSWVADGELEYHYYDYLIHMVMHLGVWSWNSNVYSIAYVWDIDNCYATLFGVPQDFAAYLWITYEPNQYELFLRMKVQPTEGTPQFLSLPEAPDGYWYPQSLPPE